jgi:TldD protein
MRLDLEPFSSDFSGYTELRAHKNTTAKVMLVNGSLTDNSRGETGGCSARVYKNGAWGFASSPDPDQARDVLRKATRNGAFLAGKGSRPSRNFLESAPKVEKDFSTKKARLGQKELVNFVREIDEYIQKKYPALRSRRVILSCLDMEKTLRTSSGASGYSLTPRSHVAVTLGLERDGATIEIFDSIGGLGQFEDVFSAPSQAFATIDELYRKLKDKQEGGYAEAGTHECILAPDLAGILAHEAVGHTTEADLVLGGSVAGDLVGQQVASPLVSLVDYAHTFRGEICPVPVFLDDEGTPAEDCVIIEKGVLKNFMHNKESAAQFDTRPLGNARAFQFYDEPLIRMRNTAIEPGTSKLDEMIASIDKGYLLSCPANGQADSTGEFMFAVTMGYEIKGGKLGRAIQNTTISGVAFEMLKTVSMVSDDMAWSSNGFCGKKQPMSVGMGGPAIKCKVNLGGR